MPQTMQVNCFHFLYLILLCVRIMAAQPPQEFSMINVNGEEYIPTPHELLSELPTNMIWTQAPLNELFLSDPDWFDGLGQNQIQQRRIWAKPTESEQISEFSQLLSEYPQRGLTMIFESAVKGKPHIIRFLLGKGVKAYPSEDDGDHLSLTPLHAAAFQGHLKCVKILIEEGRLSPDTTDEFGATPLMRACSGAHPDIVEHLLSLGADISRRQNDFLETSDHPTMNALDWAAWKGSSECLQLILKHAEEKSYDINKLVTQTTINAAAISVNTDMIYLLLDIRGIPRQIGENSWTGNIANITDDVKQTIETAFEWTLRQSQYQNMKRLLAYLETQDAQGVYHWSELKNETIESLVSALWRCTEQDDEEHQAAFSTIFGILYSPNSRFTNQNIQERKGTTLNDAYFNAAKHGSLNMMHLIESKYQGLDVNHLSKDVPPYSTSPLYIAAGAGEDKVVQHLLDSHKKDLNIHLGMGRYVNGPTALWVAIWNGHVVTARLLLESAGGPVDGIDDVVVKPGEHPTRIIMTALQTYRAPVRLISESVWAGDHGTVAEPTTSSTVNDKNGRKINYVVLKVEEIDASWWNKIQLRRDDADLLSMEQNGRGLMEDPTSLKSQG